MRTLLAVAGEGDGSADGEGDARVLEQPEAGDSEDGVGGEGEEPAYATSMSCSSNAA